ncbi:hypothetical protein [Xanthomonas arboricola]|uniref:hypothetical protein n=1 Tax=Xanthomonas arboricola TaxID=56448 RepID=UPI002018D36A|nr:hypothetical protein [Xanthomonas arboricola]MDN0207333.1 hypothetical protein [Xanthomonas arboricola pv. corylina]MDN0211589.1 hypothetical protein [Xanthomonas arboricola pv. corylina]UQQ10754.1 hypothetical protein KP021_00035 [Xanthomonas arboricola pv. corylina]
MSLSVVKNVIKNFSDDPFPKVLAIKGSWGVGKTYAWHEIIKELRSTVIPSKYAYVSLFGIRSMAELRTAILASTQPSKLVGEQVTAKLLKSEWKSLSRTAGMKAFHHGRDIIAEIPYAKQITIGFDALSGQLIRDTLICLDDFERISENSEITQKDVLGLISLLKNERGCKIALLFNSEKLVGSTYAEYREKVVDMELTYAPTADESFNIAVPATSAWRERVKNHCKTLQIKNIRVLKKIAENIEIVSSKNEAKSEKVVAGVVSAIVLITWVVYDSTFEKPAIEFLRKFNAWDKAEDKSEQHKLWIAVLRGYGWGFLDELDNAILNFIENGYLEGSDVIEQIRIEEQKEVAKENSGLMEKAWALYHDGFGDNESDVVAATTEAVKLNSREISPINLHGAVVLLRDLDHDEAADSLIDYYIEGRAGDSEVFDLHLYPWDNEIIDPVFKSKFAQALSTKSNQVDLRTALNRVAIVNGWGPEDELAIAQATEEDFYKLFLELKGRNSLKILGSSLKLSRMSSQFGDASIKATGALRRIALMSRIDRRRVERLGIELS